MELSCLTLGEASSMLSKREATSVELTTAVLDQVAKRDDVVRAYVTVCADEALAQAREADAKLSAGTADSPLCGVPMALKDNLCTKGTRTTCSSAMLKDYVPPYDATVVRKLREAGAVFVGKTNLDEFAMGSSTENSAFFTTTNPWDSKRVPGGSSGGSAAAVAAHEAVFGLGSDTGGSVRLPASFCGVVGLKPTYGRVSRFGLIAFGSSLDQIGPFAKNVTDCATVLGAIAGKDEMDSTSVALDVPDFTAGLKSSVRGLRVGLPSEYLGGVDEKVLALIRNAVQMLVEAGAVVEETSLPHTKYALPVYYIIAPAEASANLARYDGVKYGFSDRQGDDIWEMFSRTRGNGFGPEVKRRIMLGTYALSSGYYDAYYLKAQKARQLIKEDFVQAFDKFDVLITPTSPTVAFGIGEKTSDPLSMYLSDVATVTVNAAGIPGISVPCGLADGMPVGVQLLGNYFDEATVLRASYAIEQSLGDWTKVTR